MKKVIKKNCKDPLDSVVPTVLNAYIPLTEVAGFLLLTYLLPPAMYHPRALFRVFHQLGVRNDRTATSSKGKNAYLESEAFLKAFTVCLIPSLLNLG